MSPYKNNPEALEIKPIEPENSERTVDMFPDGMDAVVVPDKITAENYQTVFGGLLPEGVSPEMFKEDGIELLLT